MEAIRKQASKLREQVARQQQAVFKQFSGRFGHDSTIADEAEILRHQELKKLYHSTKAAKQLQRDIARGVEGFISVSSKQMDTVTKLAEGCCKYGDEYQDSGFALARSSLEFGTSRISMEKEMENVLRILGDQVYDPLRTMIMGAPLEDARRLTLRYERIRRDVESQRNEVLRRQLKSKELHFDAEDAIKLQNAETKLFELKTTLYALGREAHAAMMSVQARQREVTFQRLHTMVGAEISYHQNVAAILDKLHTEMATMEQNTEPAPESTTLYKVQPQTLNGDPKLIISGAPQEDGQSTAYFIAKVIHPFDAQADAELSLSIGEYVVVRQVAPDGWSEGECKGKAGWFPSAYVEQQDRAPASKVIEARFLT